MRDKRLKPLVPVVWMLVILAVIAAASVVAIRLVHPIIRGINAKEPLRSVVTGSQLQWRQFDYRPYVSYKGIQLGPEEGEMGDLLAADFDGDGADEIAVIQMKTSNLYELDGEQKSIAIKGREFLGYNITWDYNDDGCFDIVPELGIYVAASGQYTAAQAAGTIDTQIATFPVVDISGNVLHTFSVPILSTIEIGDFDNDGKTELLTVDTNNHENMNCIGSDGIVQASISFEQSHLLFYTFDANCDKYDDLMFWNQGWYCAGIQHRPFRIDDEIDNWFPVHVADFSNDGYDDIVLSDMRYYNPHDDELQQWYQVPDIMSCREATSGDYDGNGQRELACISAMGSNFYLLQDGQLIYHEQLGEIIWRIATARAGGQDHVVILTDRRLLVYP